MNKTEWILCPICGNKTRTMIREDTELRNFPLYCPKCNQRRRATCGAFLSRTLSVSVLFIRVTLNEIGLNVSKCDII